MSYVKKPLKNPEANWFLWARNPFLRGEKIFFSFRRLLKGCHSFVGPGKKPFLGVDNSGDFPKIDGLAWHHLVRKAEQDETRQPDWPDVPQTQEQTQESKDTIHFKALRLQIVHNSTKIGFAFLHIKAIPVKPAVQKAYQHEHQVLLDLTCETCLEPTSVSPSDSDRESASGSSRHPGVQDHLS